MRLRTLSAILLSPVLAAGISSCRPAGSAGASGFAPVAGDTLTSEARFLTLVDRGDCVVADFKDISDPSVTTERLVMVDSGRQVPDGLGEGATVLTVPVTSSALFSSVYGGAVEHMGGISAVTGVADSRYFRSPGLRSAIDSGRITDLGNAMSPSAERIIELAPSVVIVSSPVPQGLEGLPASIPVIEMRDFLESTPMGRVEWQKLLGCVYGLRSGADSLISAEKRDYGLLRETAASAASRPKVLTERFIDGVWYVPGGQSYMARMLADAAGLYPWASDSSVGSLPLDMAKVYEQASDADCWLIRNYGPGPTLSSLKADNELNARFKAFKDGGVWVADTQATTLYDDFPFRPSQMLADIIYILHPDLRDKLPEGTPRYFRQAAP